MLRLLVSRIRVSVKCDGQLARVAEPLRKLRDDLAIVSVQSLGEVAPFASLQSSTEGADAKLRPFIKRCELHSLGIDPTPLAKFAGSFACRVTVALRGLPVAGC